MSRGAAGRPLRPVAGALAALSLLALPGCQTAQRQARRESTERWNRVRAEVKAKLAADQLAAGHVDDAAAELTEALRLDAANPQLLLLQARLYLAQGNLSAAERLLTSARQAGADPGEIEYLLGTIAEQRLQWDEALNHFVRAVNEDPAEITYLAAVVQNMLQFGEAAEALRLLRSYEDELGWTSAYQAAVAECCEQLGDWSGAAAAWQRVANGSDPPAVQERLGMALYRAGRWGEAIPYLEQVLARPASEPSAALRLALADCLLEQGRTAAAREQLSLVLRDEPRNLPALQRLARLFAQQGQLDRARRTAEHLLRLAPHDPSALELAAGLALRSGDHRRALALAHRLRQESPNFDSPVADEIIARLEQPPDGQ